MLYPIHFVLVGRGSGTMTLYVDSAQTRQEWREALFEATERRETVMAEKSVFRVDVASWGPFRPRQKAQAGNPGGPIGRPTCSAPWSETLTIGLGHGQSEADTCFVFLLPEQQRRKATSSLPLVMRKACGSGLDTTLGLSDWSFTSKASRNARSCKTLGLFWFSPQRSSSPTLSRPWCPHLQDRTRTTLAENEKQKSPSDSVEVKMYSSSRSGA